MKASDILLDSKLMDDMDRGEALERLTDFVSIMYTGPNISNGPNIDAILSLFDALWPTDEQAKIMLEIAIDNVIKEMEQ